MAGQAADDPSRRSYYVTDAFYEALVDAFRDWDRTGRENRDTALRESCRMLLDREARLLDQQRYDEWLALFTPECAYWMPGTPGRGDPRREITFAFGDRRWMEDRVFRLQTGYAWSQSPASRTVRLVTNHEVFDTDEADIVMCRSTFQIVELRAGETRSFAGWNGHRLQRRGDGWTILAKQINLIDCDANHRNPSIVF